jgi:hypothetical protein CRE_10732
MPRFPHKQRVFSPSPVLSRLIPSFSNTLSPYTDEELREYVLNTYAVLLTRGIYGTYVYVCDEALREYLQQYIPSLK